MKNGIQLLKSKDACIQSYIDLHSSKIAVIVGIRLFLKSKKSEIRLGNYFTYPTYPVVKTKYGKRQAMKAFGKEADLEWLPLY